MSLTGNYAFVGHGDWSLDAVGGAASGGGALTVRVPTGSHVEAAFFYETKFDTGAATGVTLTSGSHVDALASADFTALGNASYLQAHRTNVTSYIQSIVGTGSAADYTVNVSGVSGQTDGFVLAVVYSNPTDAVHTILFADGSSDQSGDNFTVSFPSPVDTSVANYQALMSLGIGYSYQSNGSQQFSQVDVNGHRLTTSAGGEDDGVAADGGLVTVGGIGDSPDNPADPNAHPTNPRSDDELYDLSKGNASNSTPFISNGATSVSVNTLNPSHDDNIFFAGFNITGAASIDTTGNDPPFAQDNLFTTMGSIANGNVLANDSDPENDPLTVTGFTLSSGFQGSVAFNPDGTFNFNPAGFVGSETFQYTISDGHAHTATATVTLNVTNSTGPTGPILPDCPSVNRPGTQDGSPSSNDLLTGPAWHNTFYFDVPGNSGKDEITNFGKDDIIVTNKALADGNHDRIITFGANGLLNLDGPETGNSVKVDGVDPHKGIRYLGQLCTDTYIYADASVKPVGAVEGYVSNDVLSGDSGDKKSNVFFYDTALDLSLGSDTIGKFGSKDLIVTTTKIYDGNGDNIIDYAANHLFDLPGGVGGPGDPGVKGEGGELAVNDLSGSAVSELQFVGATTHGGVTYYAYGLVGTSAHTSDIHFG